MPLGSREKASIYLRDLPQEITGEIWKRFERALLPLDSAGKLGVVLFQFPPWFHPGDRQREYILACKERLPQYRIAVEFRHSSWVNEPIYVDPHDVLAQGKVIAVLREYKASIYEPKPGWPQGLPALRRRW